MKKINKTIIITEYQLLQMKDKTRYGYIEPKTFEELENFILENEEIAPYLKITMKRPYGKVLQAQNYVGVIQTKSGLVIEILPKIADVEEHQKEKEILIKMLKTLKKSPFKNLNIANLKESKMPLLEVFISMFLEELSILIKKGIRSNYIPREDNLKFLKGKLIISEQIKKNFIHKERFFVEYEEFSADRVENRIIKTTLEFLYKKSNSNMNKKRIREYLFVFDNINTSKNVKIDFSKIKLDRQMKHYELVLLWAKTFLLENSFSPYKGNNVAFALLFDMNLLFESYVGNYLKREEKYQDYEVKLQDGKHSLAYENGVNKFQLKPDFVLESRSDENKKVIIADTKWKILDDSKTNSGVSQGDMYQLYAYGTKYKNIENMYLIYPKRNKLEEKEYHYFQNEDRELMLKILFFDLENSEFLNGDLM